MLILDRLTLVTNKEIHRVILFGHFAGETASLFTVNFSVINQTGIDRFNLAIPSKLLLTRKSKISNVEWLITFLAISARNHVQALLDIRLNENRKLHDLHDKLVGQVRSFEGIG
ncbi:hypothetical protein T01_14063 [Trichinella spiralis]|uniref:Uncharacterized protein n=1 Tax=Trichinella spiralis TaxID=6334 RepID=A0A0V1BZJ3_TRISP|nr:hypothetical protein T01_14063 [Trichinella spiralis]